MNGVIHLGKLQSFGFLADFFGGHIGCPTGIGKKTLLLQSFTTF